ncbi:MAG: fibronectin type III domain-containing protein [bacterium]
MNNSLIFIVAVMFNFGLLNGEIMRGPYLQPAVDMETSMGIAWTTRNPADAAVKIGANSINDKIIQVSAGTGAPFYGYYQYSTVITGLEEGTSYKYQLTADGAESPVYEFKTSPRNGRFKMVVLSDPHVAARFTSNGVNKQYNANRQLVPEILKFDPDVTLICGDLDYDGAYDWASLPADTNDVICALREVLAQSVYAPCFGNCDWGDMQKVFKKSLSIPPQLLLPGDAYGVSYYFKYGGAHFMSLSYNEFNERSDQSVLDEHLEGINNNSCNWKFSYHHEPVYVNTYSGDYRVCGWLSDTFLKNKVDIDWCGHRHTVQRSLPLQKHVLSSNVPGIIFTDEREKYYKNDGTIFYQVASVGFTSERYSYPDMLHMPIGMGKDRAGYNSIVEVIIDSLVCEVKTYLYAWNDYSGPLLIDSRELFDSLVIDKGPNTPEFQTPQISDLQIAGITPFTAKINWVTDITAKARIEYGTEPGNYRHSYPPLGVSEVFERAHEIVLQCLLPDTTYYFRVISENRGKKGFGNEHSFRTLSVPEQGSFIVGQFNFQPNGAALPSKDYLGAGQNGIDDPGAFYGWVNPSNINASIGNGRGEFHAPTTPDKQIRSTSCYIDNDDAGHWSVDLPDGKYRLEVMGGPTGSWFIQDCRIVIENGQHVLEKTLAQPAPDVPPYSEWFVIWKDLEVTVEDGALDIILGGFPGRSRASSISYLKIFFGNGIVEGIGNPANINKGFNLSIYPNPGLRNVNIFYTIPKPGSICLDILDLNGRLVNSFMDFHDASGTFKQLWDLKNINGFNVGSGSYFIKIKADNGKLQGHKRVFVIK